MTVGRRKPLSLRGQCQWGEYCNTKQQCHAVSGTNLPTFPSNSGSKYNVLSDSRGFMKAFDKRPLKSYGVAIKAYGVVIKVPREVCTEVLDTVVCVKDAWGLASARIRQVVSMYAGRGSLNQCVPYYTPDPGNMPLWLEMSSQPDNDRLPPCPCCRLVHPTVTVRTVEVSYFNHESGSCSIYLYSIPKPWHIWGGGNRYKLLIWLQPRYRGIYIFLPFHMLRVALVYSRVLYHMADATLCYLFVISLNLQGHISADSQQGWYHDSRGKTVLS